MSTVRVAGQTIVLELPERMSVRIGVNALAGQRDIVTSQQTAILLVASALMLCWPTGQRKDGAPRYQHRVLDYGADVLDYLIAMGEQDAAGIEKTKNEIIKAGNIALQLITDSFLTEEELAEARGKSKGPEAPGSVNSSGSSVPTRADLPTG